MHTGRHSNSKDHVIIFKKYVLRVQPWVLSTYHAYSQNCIRLWLTQ
jgi:hypothetical protein